MTPTDRDKREVVRLEQMLEKRKAKVSHAERKLSAAKDRVARRIPTQTILPHKPK